MTENEIQRIIDRIDALTERVMRLESLLMKGFASMVLVMAGSLIYF